MSFHVCHGLFGWWVYPRSLSCTTGKRSTFCWLFSYGRDFHSSTVFPYSFIYQFILIPFQSWDEFIPNKQEVDGSRFSARLPGRISHHIAIYLRSMPGRWELLKWQHVQNTGGNSPFRAMKPPKNTWHFVDFPLRDEKNYTIRFHSPIMRILTAELVEWDEVDFFFRVS